MQGQFHGHRDNSSLKNDRDGDDIEIRIAHDMDDMMMAFAVRAAVFMAEQSCPYREEFDGNDSCAVHMIGLVGGEPAAALRMRFFSGFAKAERLAVRKEFRTSRVSFVLVSHACEFALAKGYTRLVGQVKQGLESFWRYATRRYGALRPVENHPTISFSGLNFTAMELHMPPFKNALSAQSPATVLNRLEGFWDEPGPLEFHHPMPNTPAEHADSGLSMH